MITTRPLEGEYAVGHIGRLCELNVTTLPALIKRFDRPFREPHGENRPIPLHRIIADVVGLCPNQYVKNHTLIPFENVCTFEEEDRDNYDKPASFKQCRILWRSRKAAYFCKSCMTLDLDMEPRGFSIWRRAHQIPGIDRCPEHDEPLWHVEHPQAFERPPDCWLDVAQCVDSHLAKLPHSHPIVKRYTHIALRLLLFPKRTSVYAVSRTLVRRSQDHNLHVGFLRERIRASDYIKTCLPGPWLEAHYPDIFRQKTGQYFAPIDGLCRRQNGVGQAYAMVLAALYEDEETALLEFGRELKDAPTAGKRRRAKTAQRRYELLPLYIRHRGITANIAREISSAERFESDHAGLSRSMCLLGLPSLRYLSPLDRDAIIDFLSATDKTEVEKWCEKTALAIKEMNRSKQRLTSDAAYKLKLLPLP